MNACPSCEREFATKSNLLRHLKTSLSCSVDAIPKQSFDCGHCPKRFTQKVDLEAHTCPQLIEFRIKAVVDERITKLEARNEFLKSQNEFLMSQKVSLETQLKDANDQLRRTAKKTAKRLDTLQDQMAELAMAGMNKHSSKNKTQILNNLVPITDEHLREQARFLTLSHVRNGIDGVAQFAVNHPLKNRVAVTDMSRHSVKYKNKSGGIVNDPEMTALATNLLTAIAQPHSELTDTLISELQESMKKNYNASVTEQGDDEEDEDYDERTGSEVDIMKQEGSMILTMIMEAKAVRRGIEDVIDGLHPDMLKKFAHGVCIGLHGQSIEAATRV